MRYIDTKFIVNIIITKIADELKSKYTQQAIDRFLKKYQCKIIRDVVELLVCKNSNPHIDFDNKKLIDNLESELFELKHEETSNKISINNHNLLDAKLTEDISSIKKQHQIQNEKLLKVTHLIKNFEDILSNNNLDYSIEMIKIKNKGLDKSFTNELGL